MTTSTPTTATPPSRLDRFLCVSLGVGGELFMYGLFWGGIVLGLFALNLVASGAFGTVDASIWAESGIFTRYLFDLAGVMVVVACLPMYVSLGVTRRDFVAGAVPAGLGIAVLATIVATALFAIEGVVYDLADWPHVLEGSAPEHLYDRPDDYGVIALEWFVVYATHLLSGLLIGATFFRLGPVLGAVLLPFTALPAVGTELVLGAGGAGSVLHDALDLGEPWAPAGFAIALVLGCAAVVALRRLTRDIPIDSHRAMWWR